MIQTRFHYKNYDLNYINDDEYLCIVTMQKVSDMERLLWDLILYSDRNDKKLYFGINALVDAKMMGFREENRFLKYRLDKAGNFVPGSSIYVKPNDVIVQQANTFLMNMINSKERY